VIFPQHLAVLANLKRLGALGGELPELCLGYVAANRFRQEVLRLISLLSRRRTERR
jgi:hypothetical protein